MKPTGCRFLSFCVALATLFILLNHSALAQTPTTPKGTSSDSIVREAAVKAAATTEPESNLPDSVDPARKVVKPKATVLIGFLPADILNSRVESEAVETRYTLRIVAPSTVGKNPLDGKGEDLPTLAKKLRNPVSSLARISFENDLDFGLAANREGYRYTMNLEPVIPFALNKNWNLISRTRMPVIQQDGVVGSTMQTGFGDILQSFFLSPNNSGSFFWGAGTTFLIPTAIDTHLGAGKFGLGPAVVIGTQQRGWTVGTLARHIWSVAGHSDRADVRSTYIQPFVAYTTRSAWTYSLDTESTYDWVAREWSVPVHFEISKVFRIGGYPVSVGGAVTCWAATFTGGPQACGARFNVTPIFPAK